jgi:hypothetical protein
MGWEVSSHMRTFTDVALNRKLTQRLYDLRRQKFLRYFESFTYFALNKEALCGESAVFEDVRKKYFLI